jgi:hypothetical protein
MSLTFTAWTPQYEYIGALRFARAEFAKRQNAIGRCSITGVHDIDVSQLVRDAILVGTYTEAQVIQRTLWFVRRRERVTQSKTNTTSLVLVDENHLLRRRIIAYPAGSANSSKTDQASALMAAFVREQFVTATDTGRNAPLLVPDPLPYGSTQPVSFAHDLLIDALGEICDTEADLGNWMGFGVEPTNWDGPGMSGLGLTFRVYGGVRGVDRTQGPPLSAAAGSLQSVRVTDDWTDEATRVYVGGAGDRERRLVGIATRSDVGGLGPFGLIEDWRDATNIKTSNYLATKARAELYARRARTLYTAPIAFGAGLRWGEDIGFGDSLPIDAAGTITTGRLTAYGMECDADKGTVVSAVVEGEL